MGQVLSFPNPTPTKEEKPLPTIDEMEKADWGIGGLEKRSADFKEAMIRMKDEVGYIGCTEKEDIQLNRVWEAMRLIQEHLSKMRNSKYAQIVRARMTGAG